MKGVRIFCKGADQELAEIAILLLERNGATVVLSDDPSPRREEWNNQMRSI